MATGWRVGAGRGLPVLEHALLAPSPALGPAQPVAAAAVWARHISRTSARQAVPASSRGKEEAASAEKKEEDGEVTTLRPRRVTGEIAS